MKPIHFTLAIAVISGTARAATLFVSEGAAPNSTTGTSLSLPSGADTDWGYWHRQDSTGVSSFGATNTSNEGDRGFSVSTIGGGNVRGPGNLVTGAPFSYFDFTNGTSTGNTTATRPSGVFNTQLGSGGVTAGAGLQLSLTGINTQSLIHIWTLGFQATGSFEVFLNGSSTPAFSQSVTSTSVTNGKQAYLFTLDFTPDSATDVLNIRYVMTAQTDVNAHVGFQAISISPIPEPASLALLALGTGVLGFRRRRNWNK